MTIINLLEFIIMPVLSGIIAWRVSRYSTRKALQAEQSKLEFRGTLKISEFRQNWINDLRNCMAEFHSYGILPDFDPSRQEQEFYRLGTKIELLMNPKDPEYGELQDVMYEFLDSAEGTKEDKYRVNPGFVKVCQKILKNEWERLKKDVKKIDLLQ